MRRRDFIASLGSATVAALPRVARAQGAMPVVGFVRSTGERDSTQVAEAFRQGLGELGFVAGQNVTIEYRYADNRLDRLQELVGDLVRGPVALIAGNSFAAEAARAATTVIPIVFVTADDPVQRGLVASLSRPGGNVTGLTFFGGGQLGAKRAELLHDLLPSAAVVGLLMDASWPGSATEVTDAETAIRALGQRVVIFKAGTTAEIEAAFARFSEAGIHALVVIGSPFFTSQRAMLASVVKRQALPAIYDVRSHVDAGGLISYGGSLTAAYRDAGRYAGRILKGAKPSELPVAQPTAFELVINLKTAKSLGLTVPPSIMLRADDVIE